MSEELESMANIRALPTAELEARVNGDRAALEVIDRLKRELASERVNVEALRTEKSNLAARLRMIEQDSQGKPTGICPGTTRGNLGENSPALRVLPSAWYRGGRSSAPGEAAAYDVECYYGSNPPDESPGWLPLYRRDALEQQAQEIERQQNVNVANATHNRIITEQLFRAEAERDRLSASNAALREALEKITRMTPAGWSASIAIARAALAAHEPATPGPTLGTEASPEASGGRELLPAAQLLRLYEALAAADRLAHQYPSSPFHDIYWKVRGHDACTVCADPYIPPPGACPSPIGGKETQADCRAAGQCGCEEKP